MPRFLAVIFTAFFATVFVSIPIGIAYVIGHFVAKFW